MATNAQAQAWSVFSEGAKKVFSNWTALSLAVENGWGGSRSRDKANNLLEEVLRTFQKPATVYHDELRDKFEEFMLNEMRCDCEDDSCDQVARLLVDIYRECSTGNFQKVTALLGPSASKAALESSKSGNTEADSDSSDGDSGDERFADAEMEDAAEPEPPKPPTKVIDDDGFETVSRRRR